MATATIEKREFPMFIGGEWVRTNTPHTVRLPYDGTPVGEIFEGDASTAERAVTAAHAGAAAMAALTQYERAELLERMRRLLERDARSSLCWSATKAESQFAKLARKWTAASRR